MTLCASRVRITFVLDDADFSTSIHKGSTLYTFTLISDQVLGSIASRSSKDDYKASSAPCKFNLVGLTLFPLKIWLSS